MSERDAAQKSIFCFNDGCSQVQPPGGIFWEHKLQKLH